MDVEMAIAWDKYVGEEGDPTIHPMFAAGFAAGWQASKEDLLHSIKVEEDLRT